MKITAAEVLRTIQVIDKKRLFASHPIGIDSIELFLHLPISDFMHLLVGLEFEGHIEIFKYTKTEHKFNGLTQKGSIRLIRKKAFENKTTESMDKRAITLVEAKELCKKYQYLVGELFIKSDTRYGRIELVAVAPYDMNNQWQFIDNYKQSEDPLKAIKFYRKPDYDVLVVATFEGEKTFRDINTYISESTTPIRIL